MANRRRKSSLEGAHGIVDRALRKAGLSEQALRLRIAQQWKAAVGEEIAARTEPLTFRRGTLTVRAASPTWQQELSFLKTGILAQLNAKLGRLAVRELKVVSGALLGHETPNSAEPPRPQPTEYDWEVAREASLPLRDPELRAAFTRLIAADLGARRLN